MYAGLSGPEQDEWGDTELDNMSEQGNIESRSWIHCDGSGKLFYHLMEQDACFVMAAESSEKCIQHFTTVLWTWGKAMILKELNS